MTVNEQLVSILIMTLSGILIGAIIDGTRSFLSAISPNSFLRKIAYGVELLVWALLGAITFYILFLVKGGEWRLVDPLAQVLGIFLYESFFQPLFRFLGRVFIIIIIKPIFLLVKFVISIIKMIIRLIIRIITILMWPFYKIYTKIRNSIFHKIYLKLRNTVFKKR